MSLEFRIRSGGGDGSVSLSGSLLLFLATNSDKNLILFEIYTRFGGCGGRTDLHREYSTASAFETPFCLLI